MLTKRCSKCGEVKAVDLFPRNAARKDGLGGHCSECRRRRYVENKDAVLEQQRRYRQENKDAIRERKRLDYQKNKEIVKERVRLYRQEDKETCRERERRYRQVNKDRIIEAGRRYSKTETFRERSRLRGAAGRASLNDVYVKKRLKENGVAPNKINPELVESKKGQLALTRAVRAAQNYLRELKK